MKITRQGVRDLGGNSHSTTGHKHRWSPWTVESHRMSYRSTRSCLCGKEEWRAPTTEEFDAYTERRTQDALQRAAERS